MTRKERRGYWWLVFVPFVNIWWLAWCMWDVLFGED